MILTVVPFDRGRNFGRACNEAMSYLHDDDWAVILDHDAMWTTPHWYAQFEEAAAFLPDAGAFAVMTNRIASPWQVARESVRLPDDILEHRRVGDHRLAVRTLLDITCTKGFGGVATLISKSAWAEAGGYADGMYCVDHSIFFRLKDKGRKFYLIEGLYVYHLRASSSARPPLPAQKWEECPCRGAETMPSIRIQLP